MSLPLRECGLKSYALNNTINSNFVTPLAGVWIEILTVGKYPTDLTVTPLAGEWIEMFELRFASGELLVTPLAGVWIEIWVKTWRQSKRNWSLPLRKCELKYLRCICYYNH